ncbi:class I SAM-dependent RNA methyltransferase [Xanthobacter tagetidis]|uniref:Class I SAM-dependent RNA methyltransferase n=1 Tax=Xanthobacter tagetidis TaxID=60216 RepID=A0A3L7ADH9_9HYPH|nr:class I SAM-dependent RNA methyltransferase [Xanthobacter tagetidis]MBB6305942.1 23S rRNA (uracil1939-C5)-methyltransferase [Xanthobacter tagetidis]RLP78459.1 class I SAM-dependent RNA methyltransferase [Xanthobacter tagetidis]
MELLVTRMGAQGDAVAEGPDGPLFVPYALPGERVAASVAGERARLEAVLDASPERVAPACRHFGRCGGCLLQHWELSPYLAWKRSLVTEALSRERIAAEVAPVVDAHGAGRRRVIFHARHHGAKTVVGFAERKSHAMVDLAECPVLAPDLDQALPAARAVAQALAPRNKPLDIQVIASATGLDLDVRGSGPLPPALLMDLAQLAERFSLARVTRHGELVLQRTAPVLMMGRARVELPPAAFLQATAEGEARLAAAVAEGVAGAKRVADLFAGIGTFALRLAESARVHAVEGNAPAVAALLKAARATAGLKGVDGEARDLFRRPLLPEELSAFDAVVIDPPRQGAEAQARQLASAKVGRVVYVSCSATSFARDARVLIDGGFRLGRVTPFDQFRFSPHVELVGVFQR